MTDINLTRMDDGTFMVSADVAVHLDRALTLACERLAKVCADPEDTTCVRRGEAACPVSSSREGCLAVTPAMWRDVLMKEAEGE